LNELHALMGRVPPEERGREFWCVVREAVVNLLFMLSPMAPHISDELAQLIGEDVPLISRKWPEAHKDVATSDMVKIAVQVNGRLRSEIEVAREADQKEVESMALEDEKVRRHTEGKTLRKIVYVPGRLINLVVG